MVWLFSLTLNCGLFYTCCYIVSDCFLWFKTSAFKRNSENSPDINFLGGQSMYICISIEFWAVLQLQGSYCLF